ncbi:MAG: ABC transporter ATP-binding protein [Myxococcales bacterium]|nr:ABC transporter ATP-binding protein [Myxococcales bacterium]
MKIRTERVGRVYDESYALVDATLTFEPGTSTAVLGANGAGKSTLLGLLSSALRPSEGEVYFGLVPGSRAGAETRACIGYVGHRPMVYSDLTARENLDFFAKIYSQSTLLTDAVLEKVGLSHAADRMASTFSRGMLQRLAIARALLHEPSILLLDEPFTGLDLAGVERAARLFVGARERGATVVWVTHDLELSEPFVDHVVVLRHGRVTFQGRRSRPLIEDYRLYAQQGGAVA